MSPPLDPSQLIFPSAHTTLNQTLTSLKRKDLSISNRLQSIVADAAFVERVASIFRLPLIANERCGSWYVRLELKAGSAYFKSTDGHHGQWSFSLRRLNMQVLEVIGKHGGCIIVDSTRRGKSMPDALSKTVPVWIAVLNHLLFPETLDECHLRTPEDVVSQSEHACIDERIPAFVVQAESLQLDKQRLRKMLRGKPLRPLWVTPDTDLSKLIPNIDLNLVVLCTASGRTSSERSIANYVQGAADDSESWALGLDATTFWRHSKDFQSTSEDELPAVINSSMSESRSDLFSRKPVLIKPTRNLWISNNDSAVSYCQDFDLVISCSDQLNEILAQKRGANYLRLSCTTGKVGSRQLRSEVLKLEQTFSKISSSTTVLIACHTGRDLAVGVALAVLCRCCLENGLLRSIDSDSDPIVLNKAAIKHRLSWIMVSMPDASPSRATLQSVNAFLLG